MIGFDFWFITNGATRRTGFKPQNKLRKMKDILTTNASNEAESPAFLVGAVSGSYSFNLSLDDLPNEEWKDIPDYDGMYQCSNYGRIKTLKREFVREIKGHIVTGYTIEKIRKPTLIKPKNANISVLYLSLKVNGVRKTDTVNQWVGITFIGDKKKGYHFQHKNKNGLDNRRENIEQVTLKISKSNDHKKNKRTYHNYPHLPKQKLKIEREDGALFTFSEIVKEYGRSAYFNILKGSNVRGFKWNVSLL
jgi:hypothetical protein